MYFRKQFSPGDTGADVEESDSEDKMQCLISEWDAYCSETESSTSPDSD